MKKVRIGWFFEDVAHKNFITALVKRVLREKGMEVENTAPLCERGGSLINTRFKEYMSDWGKQREKGLEYDLIVVVHDCNCKGKEDIKKKFQPKARKAQYPEDRICYAVPDPYIERWYLADTQGFKKAIEGQHAPDKQPYVHNKNQKSFYKDKVEETIKSNEIQSALTGAEYGDRIAEFIDLETVGEVDQNFKEFIESLRIYD